jgi:hypothetical protein
VSSASDDASLRDHLSEDEVLQIVSFIADSSPIIVGGQSINIWARHYSDSDPALAQMQPLTSKDVDFYASKTVAEQLASHLTDSKILLPTIGDATPNAAVVIGKLGNRKIAVDFLATILGVPNDSITDNYVAIKGTMPGSGKPITLCLMHPLDCLKSRLSNINILNRFDEHALTQATASLKVLEHFIDEVLTAGVIKSAQRTLHALPYVYRDLHLGQKSHISFGNRLNFSPIFEKFSTDTRLDERWRHLYFIKAIDRQTRRAIRIADRLKPKSTAQLKPKIDKEPSR